MGTNVSTGVTDPTVSKLMDVVQPIAALVLDRCEQLGRISEDADRLTRTFCSDAMQDAHRLLRGWMEATGLECRLDATGNLIGTLPASSVGDGHRYLVGSHLDTVVDAGKYDGVLGVLLAVGMVELLTAQNIRLPFAVDVIAFSEEEGVRYGMPFIGSRAVAGTLSEEWLERVDDAGITIASALSDFGADPRQLADAAYDPTQVLGFLEPHIEQGTVLENEGVPLGIVETIAGQTRASLRFDGTAGHAGTVAMDRRQDALTAAAVLIMFIEQLGRDTAGLYTTVGRLSVEPDVANVIPSRVRLRIDVRHASDSVRKTAVAAIGQRGNEIAEERGVKFFEEWSEADDAIAMDSAMSELLDEAIAEIGLTPKRLVSGAGHDAVAISDLAPTAMLFVRSPGGVSHHPDEAVEEADVALALAAMVRFMGKAGQCEI